MAILRITNVSPTKLWLRDLYRELAPSETSIINRTSAEMGDMVGLQEYLAEGKVVVDIDLEAYEPPGELIAVWPLGLNWRPTVLATGDLPLLKNRLGDTRLVVNTLQLFAWDGANWVGLGGGGGGAPIDASYLVATTNGALSDERVLAVTSDLTLTDGGPNTTMTVGMAATTVAAGPYGSNTSVPSLVVDANGRLTSVANTAISFPAAPIQSVTGTAPINVTAGANPVVSHNNSGAVAGTYGDASNSARVTVDAKGHVTAATTVPISITAPIGTFILGTGPIQTISANTDQITPVAVLHRIQVSGENKALTSTPQINLPGAVLGQVVFIQNVGASFHVDLARGVAEGLSLSNANRRLDPGGTFMFVFNGSLWVEVTHTQGTTT